MRPHPPASFIWLCSGKAAGEGNLTSVRDPWFTLVNDAVDASLANGGPLRGALFWQVRCHLYGMPCHAMP